MRRRRRSPLLLALCFLLSVGVHVVALLLIARWWEPQRAPPGEQVTMIDLRDLAPEPTEPEPKEPPPQAEPPEPPKPADELKDKKKEPEVDLEELPEPEPQEEPEPEEQPKPQEEPEPEERPPDFVLEQLKMVEQPDELDEPEEPQDVDYLSNINRKVEEQTRAKVTNLEQDAVKPEAKQLEPSEEKTQGTASEDVIAQEKEAKSRLDRQAPQVKPELQNERPEQNDPKPKSLLAMRELEPRDHKLPAEAYEALADEAPDGTLRGSQKHEDSIAKRDQQARIDKHDQVQKFKLSHADLEALFGKDIDAKKSYEAKKQSKSKGVWDDQRAHWQSPLENMVPEVQVGNQTALGSRKDPFARYIAQMHRKIHDAWAWGFLDQLDTRGRSHPLNDYELWTRMEIVLNGDGTIDSVKTVHHSGKMAFDAAAREIVFAAGPFPGPPSAIMSKNGKIYVHWAFHRDERACGTFGAQPFILDSTGSGDRPDPDMVVRGGGRGSSPRRLQRGGATARAPAIPEGPVRPPTSPGAGPTSRPAPSAGKAPSPSAGDAGDAQAQRVANEWLHFFAKGDIDKTVSRSGLPFFNGRTAIASTRGVLAEVLVTMSAESKTGGRPKAAKMMSAAQLRKLFGSVPAGVEDGSGRVYGLTKVGGEYVVLIVEKKFGAWKVVGLTR